MLSERNYARVVYLGDGAGDVCPCMRLRAQDFVLARQHYPGGATCSLLHQAMQCGARMAKCFRALPETCAENSSAGPGASVGRPRPLQQDAEDSGGADSFLTPTALLEVVRHAADQECADGNFPATVCPWSTPAEAAQLLLALSRTM